MKNEKSCVWSCLNFNKRRMKIFLFAKLTAPGLRAVFLCPKGVDNMKIKVKQNIYDRKNDLVLREKGAGLEVSEQRGRAFCI